MDKIFFIINEASVIEYGTPPAIELFGYTLTELQGQPLTCVLRIPRGNESAPDSWLSASIAPLLLGIHRDGHTFALRLQQEEIHGAGQTHYQLSLHDPGLPSVAEGIFSRHQELYELATRQGRISIWEVDYRTNHLQFSPVLARMLGIPDAQIPTTLEGWVRYFHPDDWQILQRQTECVLRGETSEINAECRMLHVDGTVYWTLTRGTSYFDEQGKAFKTVGTTIDITDRKKAEAERDLFFTLSLDLLCIADTNGFFRRVNPAFSRTLGYSEEVLTSRPFFDFVHPDDLPATQKALVGLSEGKNVIAFENRYRCQDGGWRWLSWTCPAVQQDSRTTYAVARDVTEAKRVEAELQRAKTDAEQANRAKSEFLSRMSHELRTPLNAILGFGQLLQRETLTNRQRQQGDMIVKGGRHLLNLINEVMDISRIEVGRLDLSHEPVELEELIQEVVSLSQPLTEQRRIRLFIDKPSVHQRYVLADKQRLKQVLLNLVSNAIKYNQEGGEVRLGGEEAAQGRFLILVQDTGPGIPLDKQHRLFTPFDRLGAESTAIEGSGLGLMLSKRLVEIMEGKLTLSSKVGAGTTVTVDLALTQDAKQAQEAAVTRKMPLTIPTPLRTLLYIEDNPTNVKLIEAVLSYRPGVRLLTALQGGSGVDLARQHPPDLILLDVHLPDVMGDEVLAWLRAEPRLRDIPVVVISADATKPQIERLLQAGAREYLTKPIEVEHLLRVLDRYLQKES